MTIITVKLVFFVTMKLWKNRLSQIKCQMVFILFYFYLDISMHICIYSC